MTPKRQIIIMAIATSLLMASCGLVWFGLSFSRLEAPADYESSRRSYRASDESEDLRFIAPDNATSLSTVLPSIATAVINNVYTHHYDTTGKLERDSRLTKEVILRDNTATFSIVFRPSQTTYYVTVTIKDIATRAYTISIKREDES